MDKRILLQGFSLIELLIAVALALIVMLIAVPSLQNFIDSSRVMTARDKLHGALIHAQQEALRQNVSTYFCPSSNSQTCDSSWDDSSGWISFVDKNRNGQPEEAEIIAIFQGELPKISSTNALTRFFPSGHAEPANFLVCANVTANANYQVTLHRTGRIEHVAHTTACTG